MCERGGRVRGGGQLGAGQGAQGDVERRQRQGARARREVREERRGECALLCVWRVWSRWWWCLRVRLARQVRRERRRDSIVCCCCRRRLLLLLANRGKALHDSRGDVPEQFICEIWQALEAVRSEMMQGKVNMEKACVRGATTNMKGTDEGCADAHVATKDWRNAVRVAERAAGAGDCGTSPSARAQRCSRRAVLPPPLLCVLLSAQEKKMIVSGRF